MSCLVKTNADLDILLNSSVLSALVSILVNYFDLLHYITLCECVSFVNIR